MKVNEFRCHTPLSEPNRLVKCNGWVAVLIPTLGIIMSRIRHVKGAGKEHDTVSLNFVGKYKQRATKLIKTAGF
jgi:hypothetical protein